MPSDVTKKGRNREGCQLSLFDDSQLAPKKRVRQKSGVVRVSNISHEGIEELCDDDLRNVWLSLRREWFPQRRELDSYQVKFSRRRQKRTLACCDVYSKKVTVAREMAYNKYVAWLSPLIYHEMCHAVLGSTARRTGKRRNLHGAEFKALEMRHPEILALNKWISDGGWVKAIRSDRAKRAAKNR